MLESDLISKKIQKVLVHNRLYKQKKVLSRFYRYDFLIILVDVLLLKDPQHPKSSLATFYENSIFIFKKKSLISDTLNYSYI